MFTNYSCFEIYNISLNFVKIYVSHKFQFCINVLLKFNKMLYVFVNPPPLQYFKYFN